MKADSARRVFRALSRAEVRFLIVGGLAVSVYGYLRLTLDIDLVVQLAPGNIRKAFDALASAGYHPLVPVTAEQFADAAQREAWIREKGMRVLRFHSDDHPQTPVDLFVEEPFVFDEEYERATTVPAHGTAGVRVVALETLRRMKQAAGRPQDILDLENIGLRGKGRDG